MSIASLPVKPVAIFRHSPTEGPGHFAAFLDRTGVGTECLRALRDAPVSHDNYFHAVLGLMQVQTSVYRRSLDPYAACNAH